MSFANCGAVSSYTFDDQPPKVRPGGRNIPCGVVPGHGKDGEGRPSDVPFGPSGSVRDRQVCPMRWNAVLDVEADVADVARVLMAPDGLAGRLAAEGASAVTMVEHTVDRGLIRTRVRATLPVIPWAIAAPPAPRAQAVDFEWVESWVPAPARGGWSALRRLHLNGEVLVVRGLVQLTPAPGHGATFRLELEVESRSPMLPGERSFQIGEAIFGLMQRELERLARIASRPSAIVSHVA